MTTPRKLGGECNKTGSETPAPQGATAKGWGNPGQWWVLAPPCSPSLGASRDRGVTIASPHQWAECPQGSPQSHEDLPGTPARVAMRGPVASWGLAGTPRCHATHPTSSPTLPSSCQAPQTKTALPTPGTSGDGARPQQEGEWFPPTPAPGPMGTHGQQPHRGALTPIGVGGSPQ